MSRARIYARNLFANWIGYGANLVVMFFLSPFVVRGLGTTTYGVWSLIVSLTCYLGLAELGTRAGLPGGTGPAPGGGGAVGRVVDRLSWWIRVPDRKIGWPLPALWAGAGQAWRRRPDVVFSTTPAWTSHLAACGLSRLLGVPWVADFRDPWCGSVWQPIPHAAHRAVDRFLEALVVRRADRIPCAVDAIRLSLAARCRRRSGQIETVLNGFDAGQIDRAQPVRLDDRRCVLLHSGTLYGPRSPGPLLEALRRPRQASPADAGRVPIAFVGPAAYGGRRLTAIIEDYGAGGERSDRLELRSDPWA